MASTIITMGPLGPLTTSLATLQDKGKNGHKGEYECFHKCQRGILLEIWLSLMSTLEDVQKPLEVMGLFEEVSKLVLLWCSFKHGSHRKTL
jgi:hypothetical protein